MTATQVARAGDELRTGPTDREVIEALQRIASARAHLVHAEQRAVERVRRAGAVRIPEIEEAHAELTWAKAAAVASRWPSRAARAVDAAEATLRERLARRGFDSFDAYLAYRNGEGPEDLHLALARREFDDAQRAWMALQSEAAPTVIIDLTGDEPRVL